MVQKLIQIGNSQGIIIPSEVRKRLGLKKGSKVTLELGLDGRSFVVTKDDRRQRLSTSVTPDFLRALERVNERYGPALEKLAKI